MSGGPFHPDDPDRCIGCFHDFRRHGACGGCGLRPHTCEDPNADCFACFPDDRATPPTTGEPT